MNMKRWLKRRWTEIKVWLYALLVSLGIIAGGTNVLFADDINLSWNNATQWDDATPLVAGDLDETVITYEVFALGTDVSLMPRNYSELVRVPATQTTYLHANQVNGIYCYIAYHVATNGFIGLDSNEACKTVDIRIPGRPTGMSAN